MSNMNSFCEQLVVKVVTSKTDPITGFLLESFLGLLKEEQESVDQKVDKLIASHYKAGITCLEDAQFATDERRQKLIETASDEFRKASTVEVPLTAAKAMFYVGVCYNLLGEKILALNWYEKAYQASQGIESKLFEKSKSSKLDAAAMISLPLTTVYGAAWLMHRKQQKNKARGALLELRGFLMPLSNLLIAYKSRLPTLQTTEQREKTYQFLLAALPQEAGALPPPPPPVQQQMRPTYEPTAVVPPPSIVAQPVTWGYLIFSNGKQVKLMGNRLVVGRIKYELQGTNPEIDLTPLPEAVSVSHLHAALEHTSGHITVTDLKSRNATFINGTRLEPGQPTQIHDGDTIQFGRVSCTFKKA